MAIDPPYRFDPWQNLINVHWPSGEVTGGVALFTWNSADPENVNPAYFESGYHYSYLMNGWILVGTYDAADTGESAAYWAARETLDAGGYTDWGGIVGRYWTLPNGSWDTTRPRDGFRYKAQCLAAAADGHADVINFNNWGDGEMGTFKYKWALFNRLKTPSVGGNGLGYITCDYDEETTV